MFIKKPVHTVLSHVIFNFFFYSNLYQNLKNKINGKIKRN